MQKQCIEPHRAALQQKKKDHRTNYKYLNN